MKEGRKEGRKKETEKQSEARKRQERKEEERFEIQESSSCDPHVPMATLPRKTLGQGGKEKERGG